MWVGDRQARQSRTTVTAHQHQSANNGAKNRVGPMQEMVQGGAEGGSERVSAPSDWKDQAPMHNKRPNAEDEDKGNEALAQGIVTKLSHP